MENLLVPKKKGYLGLTLTDLLRDNLYNTGDHFTLPAEMRRDSCYQAAIQIGFKIATRLNDNGTIEVYRK